MKLRQKFLTLGTAVLLAAAVALPASAHGGRGNCGAIVAAANILGETAQTVMEQMKNSGTCAGAVMAQAGKLEEFKEERYRLKQAQLQAQVENGRRTQEEADEILERMEEQQAACDGTGQGWGNGSGICDGTGQGWGNGSGVCNGTGQGQGYGCGGQGNGQGGGHHGGGRHCRW